MYAGEFQYEKQGDGYGILKSVKYYCRIQGIEAYIEELQYEPQQEKRREL